MARTPTTLDGKTIVSLWPTEGSRKTIVSHNWTDPTTWYSNSIKVVNEAPSVVTPLLVYDLANDVIIDSYHAKLWEEDSTMTQYRVLLEVSTDGGTTWAPKVEEDPHIAETTQGAHGDFVVDYETGQITFHSALPSGTTVRVSYYYVDMDTPGASQFIVAPLPGKILQLRKAEVQFTTDLVITDTVHFETFGYVDVFAPQYLQSNGGPYPSGTKIPIAKTCYKSMRDYYNEANGAQPTYPALGGAGFRGLVNDVVVLQWDYAAMLPISSAAGMEVRIYLVNDIPYGGEYSTATLYGLSENEPT